MNPFVSVVIPCFNRTQYLEEAVESVLGQTFTDLECILVDDGSTDNTSQTIEALQRTDPRVRYIHIEHAGIAIARNVGITHAKGEWIQLLDSDDWIHKDKIRFQLTYLSGCNPGGELVFYSDYKGVWEDENKRILKTAAIIVGSLTTKELLDRILKWNHQMDSPLHVNNTLFKKAIFTKHRFRQDLSPADDLEFFVSILLDNISFVYTPIFGMTQRNHIRNETKKRVAYDAAYIKYLEVIYKKKERLLDQIPPELTSKLIRSAVIEKNRENFNRLAGIINIKDRPVCFLQKRIKIRSILLLRVVFWLRLCTPVSAQRLFSLVYRKPIQVLYRTFSKCALRKIFPIIKKEP